jgi:predicted DNA-binding transcriptional regulator AlpA
MIHPLFLRRYDIPIKLRIQIAAEAICHKTERGNVQEIAHRYQISTSFIYELINDFINKLQAPSPKIISSEIDFDAWSRHVLLMRLEGKVSLDSISQ